MAWPRPSILVDADPTGARAIPAGYFRGGQLPSEGSIVDLAVAHRQGSLVEELPRLLMRIPNTHIQLLNGPVRHNQARALDSLWEPLAGAFKGLERNGQDVIVDAGRFGLVGSPEPLIHGADLTLLVTRCDLVALSGARSWAQTLRNEFEEQGALAALGLLVVGEGRPYSTREVSAVLSLPVTAALAWDEPAAAVFARGESPPRRFQGSALLRSLRSAATAIQGRVAANRDQLAAATPGRA